MKFRHKIKPQKQSKKGKQSELRLPNMKLYNSDYQANKG